MRLVRPLAVATAALALTSALVSANPGRQAGVESHYHYRMGERIAAGDWRPHPGKELPWGVLAQQHPVDHHWGLHALIAPFTLLGGDHADDEVAMKVATIGLAVAAVLVTYLALRALAVPWPELLAFFPLMGGTVLWRLIQLRGGGLMAALLVLWAWALFAARRPWLVGLLAAGTMMSYQGAFLALPLALVGAVATRLFVSDGAARRAAWVGCGATAAGIAAGLLVGPYGVDAARFLGFHLWVQFGDPAGHYARASHEFDPFSWGMLKAFPEYAVVVAVVAALAVAAWRRRATASAELIAFGAITVAFVYLSWRSQRLVEYGMPFVAATVGLALRDSARADAAGAAPIIAARWRCKGALVALASLILLGVGWQAKRAADVVARASPTDAYVGAAALLEARGGVIANLFQADFSLLVWGWDGARCAQGLNYYFTDADPAVAAALRTLRDGGDMQAMEGATRALVAKGATVFTQRPFRGDGRPRPFVRFAEARPDLLAPAWRHERDFARAWVPRF